MCKIFMKFKIPRKLYIREKSKNTLFFVLKYGPYLIMVVKISIKLHSLVIIILFVLIFFLNFGRLTSIIQN